MKAVKQLRSILSMSEKMGSPPLPAFGLNDPKDYEGLREIADKLEEHLRQSEKAVQPKQTSGKSTVLNDLEEDVFVSVSLAEVGKIEHELLRQFQEHQQQLTREPAPFSQFSLPRQGLLILSS